MNFEFLKEEITTKQAFNMPSTSLAFIGDAFFSLYARTKVLNTTAKSGKFHIKATKLVNAHSQSLILDKIKDKLTEEEQSIVRRAKNTHTASKSKNSGLADYKKATAFEALIGFLFLTNNETRLEELLESVDEVEL